MATTFCDGILPTVKPAASSIIFLTVQLVAYGCRFGMLYFLNRKTITMLIESVVVSHGRNHSLFDSQRKLSSDDEKQMMSHRFYC